MSPRILASFVGQCGLSMAPVAPENLADIQNMLSMGTTWFPDDMKNWESFSRFLEYAQTVDKVGAGVNPSTTFLHIAILLPKILKNSRFPVF